MRGWQGIIRGAMEAAKWTGVTLSYVCPSCRKPDRQMFVFEEATYDRTILSKASDKLAPCRRCHLILPKAIPLHTDIIVGTLEQLRNQGFPIPQVD